MLEMKYLTVTELNQQIKFHVEDAFFHCLVEGEISNVIRAQSGHIYFNLKDAGSVIRCVIWKATAMMFNDFIENGAKVEIQGKLSLYVPRGDYQLVIVRLAPLGRGNLYLAFEQLREKLQKEGLFNLDHKKAIPKHPTQIGIVTSSNAAALQDVLQTLKEHRPDIPYVVYPTLVQGDEAASQIVKAIEKANKERCCDVLLVVRGGGSIEDLWCFNDERVVRAIYASIIPVITGVGHEVDTTLSDFVADLRAVTPTAAAKLSSISQQELMQTLDHYEQQLLQMMKGRLDLHYKILKEHGVKLSFLHPMRQIKEKQETLKNLQQRLTLAIKTHHQQKVMQLNYIEKRLSLDLLLRQQQKLDERLQKSQQLLVKSIVQRQLNYGQLIQQKALLLDSLSPLKVLARGYSVTQKIKGQKLSVIKDLNELKKGDRIQTRTEIGNIISMVESVDKPEENCQLEIEI